ncbi:MAG: type II secretion system protein N [Pseudomonadota bacterium]
MKPFLLLIVFISTLLVTLITTMPLAFALDRLNLKRLGVNWASSSGTVFSGELTGVTVGAQPIGRIRLGLQPIDILGGKLSYQLDWAGQPGSGRGMLMAGRSEIAVQDVNGIINVEHLVGLASEIRRVGGRASIQSGRITFRNSSCALASGRIDTDVLARAAASFGQTGGELTGNMACDGSMLLLPLEGASIDGDQFTARIRVGLAEPSTFESRVQTTNAELSALLSLRGFTREGDVFTYLRSAQLGGA